MDGWIDRSINGYGEYRTQIEALVYRLRMTGKVNRKFYLQNRENIKHHFFINYCKLLHVK